MDFSLISGVLAIYELPAKRLTVILERSDIALCQKILQEWKKKLNKEKFQLPVFLTRDFLQKSLDSFPVEILEIQQQGQLLLGEDMAAQFTVPREHLRLQLEREFKGKALRIQQALLENAVSPKKLLSIIHQGMLPFYNGLYFLKTGQYPRTEQELSQQLQAVHANFSFLFEAVQQKKVSIEMLIDYHKIIEEISDFIDTFEEEQ